MSPRDEPLILVETLELLGPLAEFTELVRSMVARLEREGVPGLRSVSFSTRDDSSSIAVVIEFSAASHLLDHMRMISNWPEFQRFATLVRLEDARIHGGLPEGAEAWMRQFGERIVQFDRRLAAFHR